MSSNLFRFAFVYIYLLFFMAHILNKLSVIELYYNVVNTLSITHLFYGVQCANIRGYIVSLSTHVYGI